MNSFGCKTTVQKNRVGRHSKVTKIMFRKTNATQKEITIFHEIVICWGVGVDFYNVELSAQVRILSKIILRKMSKLYKNKEAYKG